MSPRACLGPTPSARQPRQRPPRPPSRHARPRPSADRPGGFEEPERRNCGVLFFGFFASDSPARPEKLKRRVVHGLRKQRRPDRGPRGRKSVGEGKRVSVRVGIGGRRILKTKTNKPNT